MNWQHSALESTAAPGVPPLSRRRRGRWLRRLGVAFLVLILTTLVVRWNWGRRAAGRLEAQLAAARAAGEPVSVEELNRWPALRVGGAGENIVPTLRAAADLVDERSDAWGAMIELETAVPLTEEEATALAAAVAENAEALWRLDALRPDSPVDWGGGYTSPLLDYEPPNSDLNGARALAVLLHADGLLAHRAGNHAHALRRASQSLDLSRAVGYQPQLVPHLVSVGIAARGTALAGDVVPELRAARAGETGGVPTAQVRTLIGRLLDERPLRDGWRRAVVGERVMVVDMVQSLLEGRVSMTYVAGKSGPLPAPFASRWLARPYLLDNAAAMAVFDAALLRGTDGAADAPAARAALPREMLHELKTSPRYFLASVVAPSLAHAAGVRFRCIAEQRLAATALAIRLYAADHGGKLPETLDALVPAYLPSIPADPLGEGSPPLRYVNDPDDPERSRVYSVGDNGVDNGGIEPDPNAPRRVVEATSDLIRYLNRRPRVFSQTTPAWDYPGGDEVDAAAPAKDPAGDEPPSDAAPPGHGAGGKVFRSPARSGGEVGPSYRIG